jgi:hypothetical protein
MHPLRPKPPLGTRCLPKIDQARLTGLWELMGYHGILDFVNEKPREMRGLRTYILISANQHW